MSKIFRVSDNKEPEWIKEFKDSLLKKAQGVDHLQKLFDKKYQFNSIEAKLADIKSRVGFDLIKAIKDEDKKVAKDMSDVDKMKRIMNYVKDMIQQEPYLDYLTVLKRCESEENLDFKSLRIDMDKFKEFIKSFLEKKEKDQDVKYHKLEVKPEEAVVESEYILHSKTDAK
jgi:hypothetical protein